MRHLMSSGYVYPYHYALCLSVCVIVHIGVDSVLLVQMFRQFQGLVKRNSNSAVPLFLYGKAEHY